MTHVSPSFPEGLAGLRSEEEARATRIARIIPPKLHLNCPFCGSEAPLASMICDRFVVGCDNDDCFVQPQVSGKTISEAWQRWDARA